MKKEHDDTLASRISRALAERIISGALSPGERLRQDHVAEEFGASHVPVREAFRRLEAQGLAVSEPRRGVRVASFDLKEVREVAEMRAALEVLALPPCHTPPDACHSRSRRGGNGCSGQIARRAELGGGKSGLPPPDPGALCHAAPACRD
ncbi:DNA-binding transcriptional MocR family regulator [Sinorhizobium fredii]